MRKEPATAVRELLRAAGLSSAIPDDPDAATALWRSWTTGRKLLLVLDDAPDEDYVDALVPSSPDSLVIVPSRSRLSGLEADLWIELGDLFELLFELSMLSTSEQFDEVTAQAVADVTLHAEMYEMPPLMRRFLLRG